MSPHTTRIHVQPMSVRSGRSWRRSQRGSAGGPRCARLPLDRS
jgi:hypothetical protein